MAHQKLGKPARGTIQVHPAGSFAAGEAEACIARVEQAFGEAARLTLIDLGCGAGESAVARQVLEAPWRRLVSVEAFLPYVHRLQQKTARATRHDVHEIRIEQVFDEFVHGEIDVALLADVLRHFERREALRLIVRLETFVNRGVVVCTPLGETHGTAPDDNALQRYRSSWEAEDLAYLGFEVEVYEGGDGKPDVAWAIRRRTAK